MLLQECALKLHFVAVLRDTHSQANGPLLCICVVKPCIVTSVDCQDLDM